MCRLLPVLLLSIFQLFHISPAPAQAGCTDPQALNFDPAATENDGSCAYPLTYLTAPVVSTLPGFLAENSGISQAGSRWWTLNDSGNGPVFFRFDPESGEVLQTIELEQAENRDWEDLTTDGPNLLLGDVGNNSGGNRTDLGIYKIPLAGIGSGAAVSVGASGYTFVPFEYEDQTDFVPVPQDSTVFDCEAMIFADGKIRLFQKNWRDRTCTHYALDEADGLAQKIETFDAGGLVTAASLSPDGRVLALLGYNQSPAEVFVWLCWDFRDGQFFNGNKRRLELGSPLIFGQSEGIAFGGNRTGYISNEALGFGGATLVPPQIRAFDIGQFVPEMVNTVDGGRQTVDGGRISPNPFSQSVGFQFFDGAKPDFLRVRNLFGQPFFEQTDPPAALNAVAWPSGWYIFEAGFRGKMVSFVAIKR